MCRRPPRRSASPRETRRRHPLQPPRQRSRRRSRPPARAPHGSPAAESPMTGVAANDLEGYFQEARSWDQDRLAAAERSKRLAWTVAGGASVLAVAAVSAVVALAPLKSVEPFVVRVDRTTGGVDVMTGLKGRGDLTYDEAVSKYFLGQYV